MLFRKVFYGIAGIYQFLRFLLLGTIVVSTVSSVPLLFGGGAIVLGILLFVELSEPRRTNHHVLVIGKSAETLIAALSLFRTIQSPFVTIEDIALYGTILIADALVTLFLLLFLVRPRVSPAVQESSPDLPNLEEIEIEET